MRATLSSRRLLLAVVAAVLSAPGGRAADVNEATERAMKAASAKVAPAVVKIDTTGGAEVVGAGKKGPGGENGIRKGTGPTTGLIVDADGFVVTSSFNFANKPTGITVTVPGRPQRFVATVVATDQTRMLTLLKIDAKGLPVPEAFPKAGIDIGQWSLALGRTSDPDAEHPPSMSVGIVSATNRIWGKAVQTDAKTSPVNYGGPLVALNGQVLGVIVPASNRAEGETAGVDVYDGGIGFAVPLEDVFAALPRLKQGKDLKRGLLGINPQGTDAYNAPPVIGAVQPDSAAARAGIQVGDKILEVDGKKIPNFSTLQHVLGPKYDGDEIAIKIARGDKEQEFKGVKLVGTSTAYVSAFLGVLPMRDDAEPGVEVRYVYPKSPAEAAGIKVGDRITKLGPAAAPALSPVANRNALIGALQRLTPGTEVKVEVKRKDGGKTDTVTAKLVPAPDALPDAVPLPSSKGKAGGAAPPKPKDREPKDPFGGECGAGDASAEDEKKDEPKKDEPKKDEKDKPKVETGLLKRMNEGLGREYWVYVPDNYDAGRSYGVIVWFHDTSEATKDGKQVSRTFRDVCEDRNFILVGPKSGGKDGWVPSETEVVMQDVKAVLGQYTIDRSRVVAHGQGNGGQMAFYVGFNARDVFRGVGTVGAVLGTNPKDNVANQPLSFFISGGDKDPLIKDIRESKDLLTERRFPVIYREMKESGKEYFDPPTFTDFIAWLDSLDRI
ncbi:PDZ domain-containing protein [Gemmata sp.]|uniref:PDZ domain-containing protein n=1 Tax=Gemmata sp. TaxID=1914242 RepID=UPI003F71CBCF